MTATEQAETAMASMTVATEQAATASRCIATRVTGRGMTVTMSAQAAKEMAIIAETAGFDPEDAAAAATRSASTAALTSNGRSTIGGVGYRGSRGDRLTAIGFARQTIGSGAATRRLRKAEESQTVASTRMLQQAATAAGSVTTKPATTGATGRPTTYAAVAGRGRFATARVASRSTGKRTMQAQAAAQPQPAVMPVPTVATLVPLFAVPIPQTLTEFVIAVKSASQSSQKRTARATAAAAGRRSVVVQRIALAWAGIAIAIDLALGLVSPKQTGRQGEGGGQKPTAFVHDTHR